MNNLKKLGERDRRAVLDYVGAEPEYNTFIIGDIETLGMDAEEIEVFALEKDGAMNGILLRCRDNYMIYSQDDGYDAAPVGAYLRTRKTISGVTGKYALVEKAAPWLPACTLRKTYLCGCRSDGYREQPGCPGLRRLTQGDAGAILALYRGMGDYAEMYAGEEGIARVESSLRRGDLHCGVFDGEKLVSIAKLSAGYSTGGMVVGVGTLEAYRNRGYASAAVSELCRLSFAQGKTTICLFYDNPQAGRIYHRIGFCEIGEYALLR